MKNSLFSILIANYNNGRFFQDCYNSIICQTYQNWEVIIVDDGSTDNSVEIIKALIASDSRFKFFENEKNEGCGYTKRRCVELANGEICGFVDPDDAITETAIDEMEIAIKWRELLDSDSYSFNNYTVLSKHRKFNSTPKNKW